MRGNCGTGWDGVQLRPDINITSEEQQLSSISVAIVPASPFSLLPPHLSQEA